MNLVKHAQDNVKTRERWLHQAQRALDKVKGLPQAIQELNGTADMDCDIKLSLCLRGGDDTARVCVESGAIITERRFASWDGTYNLKGILGDDVEISISHADTKPGCRIVKESYMAERFKEICADSAEANEIEYEADYREQEYFRMVEKD